MQKFRQPLRFTRGYVPTQQMAGDANDTIYAGENVVFKGNSGSIYAESYKGTLTRATSGAEPQYNCFIPQGTGLVVNIGVGQTEIKYNPLDPRFLTGFQILIDGRHYYITYGGPDPEIGGSAGVIRLTPPLHVTGNFQIFVLPTLCVVNDRLGLTYAAGNIIQLPKGHLLTTGVIGVTKAFLISRPGGVNAEPPLVQETGPLTGLPALLPVNPIPPFTTAYSELVLGLPAPPSPTLVALPGTGKNMPAGRYSVRICRSRLETAGYGNPSEAVEIVLQAGQSIEVTLPVVSTVTYPPPVSTTIPNQTAWRIFVTLFAVQEGITGPWYELLEISEVDVALLTGRKVVIEWRDYEVAGSQLVTFDNDPPPPARFVVMFGGIPVLLSTLGTPVTPGEDRSPGPSFQPAKAYNIEGFPRTASLSVGPVQDIVSYVEGEGRLYVLTPNYLHVATLTGNPDQPLTVRPFAQTSILRHNNLIYVEGVLYAFSARGPGRFSAEGMSDEDNVFATPVKAITDNWYAGKVLVVHDPQNEAILYIHSQDSRDPVSNKLRTMVLCYYLTLGIWSTPIWIQNPAIDTYVSGAVTLGGRTYLITNNTLQQWDGLQGGEIFWYMATPYIDQGAEGVYKNVRFVSVLHRGQHSAAAIYGAEPDIKIANLSDPGAYDLSTSMSQGFPLTAPGTSDTDAGADQMLATHVERVNVRNMRLYSIKVTGRSNRNTATAHKEPDRVDEIIVAGNIHGPAK